ncbi:MAG TPA: hypothetical protein DD001_21305 [Microcoleaceae bacterium UBA10368]|nr:hypothetical protein [Microcoleaceae cyanobacterium UBA10368]HCV29825.1 hypothetical protein [Microcoleaceae cyanobacterium UBA9251]
MTGESPAQSLIYGEFTQEAKKMGSKLFSSAIYIIMFPQFHIAHLEKQLKSTEYLSLKIMVDLLQKPA